MYTAAVALMEPTKRVSGEVPSLGDADDNQFKERLRAVTDALFRLIRILIDERPKPSKLQSILTSTLFSVIVGFVLTGIFGTYLTYYYSKQQQELAARRGFSDELNRIRIQRFGEVWERIDENELAIDNLLDDSLLEKRSPNDLSASDERANKIRHLIQDDLAIISKNRFWLGEKNYQKTRAYLDINIKYALNKLLVLSPDVTEIIQKREQAKQDIIDMRSMFLAGDLSK